MLAKVNLGDAFDTIAECWAPRIVGELNGQHVKLVKLQGEFIWHQHDDEDELFLVVNGRLLVQLVDGEVTLAPGEMLIVPRGVRHRPVALEDTNVLLFEPTSTLNTGEVRNERTREAQIL